MKMRWWKFEDHDPQLQLLINGHWKHWSQTSYKQQSQMTTYLYLHQKGWTIAPTYYPDQEKRA